VYFGLGNSSFPGFEIVTSYPPMVRVVASPEEELMPSPRAAGYEEIWSWTEMSARGEHNIGQLVRSRWGEDTYLVGFGTDHGTVAAASNWDAPLEIKRVRASHERSYERVCHDSAVPSFMLPLRTGNVVIRRELMPERLERAIGVIYRPETELQSHYFHAILPRQFDEWIWFDETRAVEPLPVKEREGMPETYPFAV